MGSIPDTVIRLAEALIFASAEPVMREALARRLGPEIDIDQLITQVTVRHAGKGFELVAAAGGW